jgi:hypothetical protein
MPGTNHQIENGFIDDLPMNVRPAAEDLLKHHTLKQLLQMRAHGVNDFLHKTYPYINEFDWINIIQSVLLTKISYFELNEHFSLRELDKLTEIAQSALDLPNNSPQKIFQYCEHRYPVFARVMEKLIILRQKKLKTAS